MIDVQGDPSECETQDENCQVQVGKKLTWLFDDVSTAFSNVYGDNDGYRMIDVQGDTSAVTCCCPPWTPWAFRSVYQGKGCAGKGSQEAQDAQQAQQLATTWEDAFKQANMPDTGGCAQVETYAVETYAKTEEGFQKSVSVADTALVRDYTMNFVG